MDGEKVAKGRGDAVVMALKKGCGREPKESTGGQGDTTTLKRGGVRYINNDNGQSAEKDKERANFDCPAPIPSKESVVDWRQDGHGDHDHDPDSLTRWILN